MPQRPEGDPAPLPHLADPADQSSGALGVSLEVTLSSEKMRAERLAYAIPIGFLVISALLFGWARDRSRLHSVSRDEATPTI